VQSILRSIVFASVGFLISFTAFAALPNAQMPACLDGPDEMKIDNARVLQFKHSTKNAYLDRAFVQGNVTEAPSVKNGHDHFVISIGPGQDDTLEIIYNKEFGAMSPINVGDSVIVCGDYITSTSRTGSYDPSPEGAIIHWIHFNPGSRANSARHEHGFVMAGSNLIGFDAAPSGDWSGRIFKTTEPTANSGPNDPSSPDSAAPSTRQTTPDPVVSQPSQGNSGNRQRNSGSQNRNQPNPGRWKGCRNLQECSARNH
jgi:hypothetical protein